MKQQERIKQKNKQRDWRLVTGETSRHFLEELRQARLAAQGDAEAFDQILFVLERLGSFRLGEVAALGDYGESLIDLVSAAALGQPLCPSQSPWHTDKRTLFTMIKDARNDALHQGAKARYLTDHTIEFALLLEDALMNGADPMTKLSDIMVRSPIVAESWHPVSLARNMMLAKSFSCLPIFWKRQWRILTDAQLAIFLRQGSPSNAERKKRLALQLLSPRWLMSPYY